jgi:protocatechuate 3,4-dioxygenase beta subunit
LLLASSLVAAPAHALDSGSISGTVTRVDGTPLAGVDVQVYEFDAWGPGRSWGAVTDDSGAYSVGELPIGDYKVEFPAYNPELNVLPEWWENAHTIEEAAVVSVESEVPHTGIDAVLENGSIISGVVTDEDGAGVPDVSIYAWTGEGEDLRIVGSASTDGSGEYAVTGLRTGSYEVQFAPSELHFEEWWADAATRAAATPVFVPEDAIVDGISPQLDRAGSIAGHVVDDRGAPVANARVSAYASGAGDDAPPVLETWTDDSGAFVISPLRPDVYTIAFTPEDGLIGEWWNDAPTRAQASEVTVVGGATTSVVDAELATFVPLLELSWSTPTVGGSPAVGATLTAMPGEWTNGTQFSYQWFAAGSPITGATEPTLVVPADLVGAAISVEVTGRLDGYQTATAASTPTAAVIPGILVAAVPSIVGVAAYGSTLTAKPNEWTPGAVFAYQWYANGAAISGATGSTLVLSTAHKDKQISVRVTGTLAGYTPAARTSAVTPKVSTAGTPALAGAARVGGVLTATPGTWTASTAFAYQWYADGAPIAGATKSAFTLTTAQDSKAITVRVTGSKPGYATVTKASASTLKTTRYSSPSISGGLGVGHVLTAKPNTWSMGMGFTYQWFANGAAITGATKPTLTLGAAQRDKQISVKVTGRQTGFTTVVASSAASARVATVSTPTIAGVFQVGSTLTAKPNTWTTSTTFSYQWYADGVAITGATRSTILLGTAHRDKQISVVVTGRKSGYGTVARSSAKSPRIALTAAPSIVGTLMVGSTLSVRTGTWTSGTTFAYQWYVNGTPVSGATGLKLTLSRGYSGKSITVRVTGVKSGYQTIARHSASGGVRSGKSAPASRDHCPSGWPIKGNRTTQHTTDWIFHVPGGQYYAVTDPEECFATESAALAWGYRKSLR